VKGTLSIFAVTGVEDRTEVQGAVVKGVGDAWFCACCVLYFNAQQGVFI
jgi:hypothetical protein